ncbi:MAG: hypothetical protein H6584_06355 [Flavobacteriales bacterium]|nr:hypothetical protein [Flavobacteriales bacterium]
MVRLKVKVFGEAVSIHRIEIPKKLDWVFENARKKMNKPLQDCLIDPYFFHLLKLSSFQSFQDLCVASNRLITNNHKGQVEIWLDRRKKARIKIPELIHPTTLFPIYSINHGGEFLYQKDALYVVQKELGDIGTAVCHIESFEIEKCVFNLTAYMENKYLFSIQYDNQELVLENEDCVVTGQLGIAT